MNIIEHTLNTIEEQLSIMDEYIGDEDKDFDFTDEVQILVTKFREAHFPKEQNV